MAAPLTVERINRAEEQAFERCLELSVRLIDAMTGPDGETVGDRPMSRSDRILRFLDLAQQGALDVLKVINPELHDALRREYAKDMAAEQVARGREASVYQPQMPSIADLIGRM